MFKTSLSTFFILFSSEGRKCDFFVRHNAGLSKTAVSCRRLVDVRYPVLYSLGQKNHNMHPRTSTDSTRQSMCDIHCGEHCSEHKLRDFRIPLLNYDQEHT